MYFWITMKKWMLIFFIVVYHVPTFSQTGPAGVGTPATNVFWIKADAGTSSTVNGTPINAWNDQSGNAINVTQTVAIQQPSFATNVLNGFPAVVFDNNSGTSPNQNDYLTAPDNPKLDNTSGYSFFTVTKMNTLAGGNARCVVSKRTAVDTDEAFMLFYYTSNYFWTDIDGIGDRSSTNPNTFTTNVGNIIDVVYDGSLVKANRTKIYEGEILRATYGESSTLVPDKVSPLNIGCTHKADERPFGGYIAEVVIYTVTVNDAQRIIVNNYLASKYDIALTTNDKYVGDQTINGDYDREVAGIGREVSGSNPTFSASVSGGMGISNISGLDAGDYILAGHASPTNMQIGYDIGGMTGTNNARWLRIWYLDITNTSTNINNNIEFDISDGGGGPVVLGTASDYVLLYRATQSGNWTELATGSAVVGDRILFNGITLTNDGYYTIGTHNYILSTLPIELLNFNAVMKHKKVEITWSTASEKNNAYFTIERSRDAIDFEYFLNVNAAGNTTSVTNYEDIDHEPYDGISYYRLKQTDTNGKFSYSNTVAVNYDLKDDEVIHIFPNPSTGKINLVINGQENKQVSIAIIDAAGKELYQSFSRISENKQVITIDMESRLSAGTYIVVVNSNGKEYRTKVIIK